MRRTPESTCAQATGTPVVVAGPGRVVLAENLYYSGGTVIVDHGGGLFTVYAHLSKIGAKVGAEVKPGDEIGQIGSDRPRDRAASPLGRTRRRRDLRSPRPPRPSAVRIGDTPLFSRRGHFFDPDDRPRHASARSDLRAPAPPDRSLKVKNRSRSRGPLAVIGIEEVS